LWFSSIRLPSSIISGKLESNKGVRSENLFKRAFLNPEEAL
jgi:hypothetical protein